MAHTFLLFTILENTFSGAVMVEGNFVHILWLPFKLVRYFNIKVAVRQAMLRCKFAAGSKCAFAGIQSFQITNVF